MKYQLASPAFYWHALIRILLITIVMYGLHVPAFPQKASSAAIERQSYLAHIAAANGAMRWNEPLEFKRWINAAPEKYRGFEWDILNDQTDVSLQTIALSGEKPTNMALSPDGGQIALTYTGGKTEWRRLPDFTLLNTSSAHRNTVYSAAFHPEGRRLFTCARDSTLRCIDLNQGASLWTASTGGSGLAVTACSPDGNRVAVASWYRDLERGVVGFVRLFDAADGRERWYGTFGVKPFLGLAFSGDGKYLAAANWDGQVAVWRTGELDADPGILDFSDRIDYTAIDDLVFHPTKPWIMAATKSGEPRIWDYTTGKIVTELRGHRQAVMAVAFSGDGRYAYTAGDEGVIHVWDAETGALLSKQFGHTGRITRLLCMPDGRRLISLSDDKTIRFWDAHAGLIFDQPNVRKGAVYAFAASPDGKRMAMGCDHGGLSFWDIKRDSFLLTAPCFDFAANALCWSPDGERVLAVNWGPAARVIDTHGGQTQMVLENVAGGSSGCAWSSDGRWMAAATRKGGVVVWDAKTGLIKQSLQPGGATYCVQFAPDSRSIAAGGHDGRLYLWSMSADSFAQMRAYPAHEKDMTIYSLAWSSDGKKIATASEDKTVAIVHAGTGKELQRMFGHAQRIWSVAYHPDGNRLASASADLTVVLWDSENGDRLLTLSGRQTVYNVAFSPDGNALYANEMAGKVQVWRRKR